FAHMRYRLARHAHGAHETYVERALPVLVGELHEFPRRRTAGVVHDHIEPAKAFDAIFHETLDVFRFAHIRNRCQNFTACFFTNRLGRVLQSLLTARANANLRAFPRKTKRRRASHPLTRAGDQSDLAFESKIHAQSPRSLKWPGYYQSAVTRSK